MLPHIDDIVQKYRTVLLIIPDIAFIEQDKAYGLQDPRSQPDVNNLSIQIQELSLENPNIGNSATVVLN